MSKDAAALYRVRNWDALYENAISRKIKNLHWVATPNKHDGRGFRRLMRMEDGVSLFGAWCLILQVASKATPRGILADDLGPLSPEDIADKTGAPAAIVRRALEACASPEVGWLEVLSISPSAGIPAESPTIPARSAAMPGESAGEAARSAGVPAQGPTKAAQGPGIPARSAGEAAVKEGREGIEGIEQNRAVVVVEVQCAPAAPTADTISDDDPVFPDTTINKPYTESGQALDQLSISLVNRLISKHWTASNAPAAIGRMERILAEAVNPELVAASIEANHASWAAWHRAHPRERKKRLEYWLADGDYLHPVSGYAAAPAVPVIDEAPVVVEELSDEELAALDAQRVQERLQEALRA